MNYIQYIQILCYCQGVAKVQKTHPKYLAMKVNDLLNQIKDEYPLITVKSLIMHLLKLNGQLLSAVTGYSPNMVKSNYCIRKIYKF